jgi:DNA repair exonuclease SbcCD nuclease subunit
MIVFAADLHLADNVWASMPEVRGDSYRSLEQIVQCAIDHKASWFVIGGDLYDTKTPPPTAVEVFTRAVLRLQAAGVKVGYIQGQHERNDEQPWASIYPYAVKLSDGNVHELEPGIIVAGHDQAPPEVLKEWCQKLPSAVNLVLVHQLARGTVPEIEGRQNWDFDPQWIPEHVRLVLMGDFHEPWQHSIKQPTLQHVTEFIYSGSTCMQSVSEPPAKSFLVVGRRSGEFQINRVPLRTRAFRGFGILTPKPTDEEISRVISEVRSLEPDSLVLVRFDPRAENIEQIFTQANERVHFMFKPLAIVDETVGAVDMTALKEVSLESCLSLVVDREKDAEFYSFLLALLQSKSPKDTLETFKLRVLGIPA